jgi:hypothetical protein
MAPENRRECKPVRAGAVCKPQIVIARLFGPLRTGNIVFQQPALGQGYGNTVPWDHQGLFDFENVLISDEADIRGCKRT